MAACAAQIAPVGKQASFASRAYASYILAEKGDDQPRSLAVAYLDPIVGPSVLQSSIRALRDTRDRMNNAYGQEWSTSELNALEGQGTLAELARFVAE